MGIDSKSGGLVYRLAIYFYVQYIRLTEHILIRTHLVSNNSVVYIICAFVYILTLLNHIVRKIFFNIGYWLL